MVRTTPGEPALLYLVRHADADIRGPGADDHLRPLSQVGQARAGLLADLLRPSAAGRIVSSPYVRCVQTVEPLATRRRRPVVLSDALAEGASIDEILRLLRHLPGGSVACTHGDVLGELARGLDTVDDRVGSISFDKGGFWVVLRDGDGLSLIEQWRAPSGSVENDRVMMYGRG